MSRVGLNMKTIKAMPEASAGWRNFSNERLSIVVLSVALATTTVLWQQERLKPTTSFLVQADGLVQQAKPTELNFRTPQEIKSFAERTYRNLYGWNFDSKTEGGVETDVKLGTFGLDANLASVILDEMNKQKVFESVKNSRIRTTLTFRPTQIVHSDLPYEVVISGDRRLIGGEGIAATHFSKKLTIEIIQRSAPFNLAGLVITKIEDFNDKQ